MLLRSFVVFDAASRSCLKKDTTTTMDATRIERNASHGAIATVDAAVTSSGEASSSLRFSVANMLDAVNRVWLCFVVPDAAQYMIRSAMPSFTTIPPRLGMWPFIESLTEPPTHQ
uniref:Secreted protein n=1 Tax=Panagrellus redivivus TaxID=6233 RepID=A0A7E4ZR41_PANRE